MLSVVIFDYKAKIIFNCCIQQNQLIISVSHRWTLQQVPIFKYTTIHQKLTFIWVIWLTSILFVFFSVGDVTNSFQSIKRDIISKDHFYCAHSSSLFRLQKITGWFNNALSARMIPFFVRSFDLSGRMAIWLKDTGLPDQS